MPLFPPSSDMLLAMIRSAEAKCDADREQAALRREAELDRRLARRLITEVEQRRRKALWGI